MLVIYRGYFIEGDENIKDTKDHIFMNARKAFSEFGYKRTSLDQIAKMSGTGKSTIYHYVDSKRTLFKEIINTEVSHGQKFVAEFLNSSPSIDNISDFLFDYRENQLNSELISKIINEAKQIGTTEAFEELARLEESNHEIMSVILDHFHLAENVLERKLMSFLIVELFNLLTIKWTESNPPLDREKVKNILRNFTNLIK